MRSRLFVVPLILALALTSACAARSTGALSPEATIALRANQVVAALDALTVPAGTSPVERLIDARVITPQEGLQVAIVIREALGHARDLAYVVEAVHSSRTDAEREAGLQRASTLLHLLSTRLSQAPIAIGTVEGRQAVVDLLRVSSHLLLMVGSVFPAPAVAPAL